MNVTEASAWHKVIRSLKAGASDAERAAGLEAATLLNTRSYTTLHAGPSSDVVAGVVAGAHRRRVAADDALGFLYKTLDNVEGLDVEWSTAEVVKLIDTTVEYLEGQA